MVWTLSAVTFQLSWGVYYEENKDEIAALLYEWVNYII